jgi:uncharacterized membrane protein
MSTNFDMVFKVIIFRTEKKKIVLGYLLGLFGSSWILRQISLKIWMRDRVREHQLTGSDRAVDSSTLGFDWISGVYACWLQRLIPTLLVS